MHQQYIFSAGSELRKLENSDAAFEPLKGSFRDSATTHFLFKLIALVMESPLRRKFFDPVKALKTAGIQSGQKILEVGCGTGFFTIPAAKLVGNEGRVLALDPHPLAIEQVVKKIRDAGLTNIEVIKADATKVGLISGSIDPVLLFGVIPSPTLPLDLLLPEMHRLLKPEGALAVWTAFPRSSPVPLTKSGLFGHVGKESGVHSWRVCVKEARNGRPPPNTEA